MNELVTRSLEENNVSHLIELPRALLTDYEIDIVTYIIDYSAKHGRTPSTKKLMKKFDAFIPIKHLATVHEPEPDPISDVFDQTVTKMLVDKTVRQMKMIREHISDEGEVPIELFQEVIRYHTNTTGVNVYSEFDRSKYFRRKSVEIPFKLLSKQMGGIGHGDFLLVVGRLGTGKSTIAQFIAKDAWDKGKRILFVSTEMNTIDVFGRIDGMVGGFNPLELRHSDEKTMSPILDGVVSKAISSKGEIIVPRNRVLNPMQIAELAKNLNVDQILIDGVYLLQPSGKQRINAKHERIAAVSNEVKQMALQLDIPVIATAQIKRGASGAGEGGVYDPEDIAGSDSLGQDPDFIIAVKPDPIVENRSELQLVKNRYGFRCATQVYVDFDTMSVIDESVMGEFKGVIKHVGVESISSEEWGKM